ncbi:MAG: DUF1080 domain-containing protein [Cyclobacteriaceae bacterium]|nr:DUF1080 domain-containing protein [Cyclobacteriaceae bacterium]
MRAINILKFHHPLMVLTLSVIMMAGCKKQKEPIALEQQQANEPQEAPWVQLFDGETLNGWVAKGGPNQFMVEDHMIVSTAELEKPGGYLCSVNDYGDFILEWEVKIDTTLNSGMQIRGQIWEKDTSSLYLAGNGELRETSWQAGGIWGYQIEIDPSPRAWSGGLYEPGYRGWLVDLSQNKEAGAAFDPNGWNKMKVEAAGNSIKTWVNGVLAVDTTDDLLASGFIGLQYHEAYHSNQAGKKVYWKNIRIKEL